MRLADAHLARNGRVYLITPNAEFGRYMRSLPGATQQYVPDPTVRRHYTLTTLTELLDGAGLQVTVAGCAGPRAGRHHERLFAVAVRANGDEADAWSRTF